MILLKSLKSRYLAITLTMLLNITIWSGAVFLIWLLIDRSAVGYFETYAAIAVANICLFYLAAFFVRCPECNKSMHHFYRPGDGLLISRALLPHEIFTEKFIQCSHCDKVVILGD